MLRSEKVHRDTAVEVVAVGAKAMAAGTAAAAADALDASVEAAVAGSEVTAEAVEIATLLGAFFAAAWPSVLAVAGSRQHGGR